MMGTPHSTASPAPVGFEWRCNLCAAAIDDRQGVIYVDVAELHAAEQGAATVKWHAKHIACDPEEREAYAIDVAELRTLADLRWWTGHLLGKQWFFLTDWADLVKDAVDGGA